jgi:TolB-like protein
MASVPSALAEALSARYTLEREIGRGGMATVFLARDIRHDRLVALKVLHPELAATLGTDRFLREIKFAARLQHPHILTVLDSGETAGQLWFTMPFVEGESLRDRLGREQQLPVELALRIATDAARALQYAHEHGVIHRDIKPENLLLTQDGSTLVADFGIARALSAGDDRLTETGISVGTPAYMSPEQAAGERTLDARTDVYALGAVLYEMLAGEPPFKGATAQAVTAKRFSGPAPKVRTVRPGVSQALDHTVAKALELVPADRFATMAEFALAVASRVASEPFPVNELPRRVPPTTARGRMRRALLVGVGVVALSGLGVVLWQRSSHGGTSAAYAAGPKRLAVLPFENLGDSADAYFADGITDAVRGKLTALPGMQVTARRSSSQYRTTSKSPQQIGKELGVEYLLAATVRWEKAPGGTSRVQVSPELIEASTGSSKWQQPFDAALTDIFQVQGDIAERVAQALDVALGAGERTRLSEPPTRNLGAYDAFLKGEELSDAVSSRDPSTLRRALVYYEKAVALDSTFVLAWARVSMSHTALYRGDYVGGGSSRAEAVAARRAAEWALALRPLGYEGHLALASYYLRMDIPRVLAEANQGLKVAPGHPELLAFAAYAEALLGVWDSALVHLRQAQLLDPRSIDTARDLTEILAFLGRYAEALAACSRGLAIAPADLTLLLYKGWIYLAQGDLERARSVIRTSPRKAGVPALVLTNYTYLWALEDRDRQRLLRLTPASFEDRRERWGAALAETYWLRGDKVKARAYADSARQVYEALLREGTEHFTDAMRHASLGLMLAFLGRQSDAIREGGRALTLISSANDALTKCWIEYQVARIYVLVGQPEKAIGRLEPLLELPTPFSPRWLRIDPAFAPLRGNPRFEQLLATK